MKCKDFEQEIYLYSELSETERIRVDVHIQECADCKELFELVSSTRVLIEQAAITKPELTNHARLTSNIMQAIAVQQKQSSSWLNSLFVRYAMVAASLILIVWFFQEQQSATEPPQQHLATVVKLNSQPIGKIINKDKKKPVSIYACIKTESCNNTRFENFKQKRF